MKKQMKSSLFTAILGLALIGAMMSSSSDQVTAVPAIQASPSQGLPVAATDSTSPASVPFTSYLSLVTAFSNGESIDFNPVDEEEQSFIWDKISNWWKNQ